MISKPTIGIVYTDKEINNWKLKYLLDALKAKYVNVRQIRPGARRVDLDDIDVLFHRRKRPHPWHKKLIDAAKDKGIPIVPSSRYAGQMYHSDHLAAWEKNNVLCAKHKVINQVGDLDNLGFGYPIILRRNRKLSSGREMYIANDLEEAKDLYQDHSLDLSLIHI